MVPPYLESFQQSVVVPKSFKIQLLGRFYVIYGDAHDEAFYETHNIAHFMLVSTNSLLDLNSFIISISTVSLTERVKTNIIQVATSVTVIEKITLNNPVAPKLLTAGVSTVSFLYFSAALLSHSPRSSAFGMLKEHTRLYIW